MDVATVVGLAGISVILAATQWVKPWIKDARYYPVVAVGWGLVINIIVLNPVTRADWVSAVISGFVAGLAAGGLYDAGKTIMNR